MQTMGEPFLAAHLAEARVEGLVSPVARSGVGLVPLGMNQAQLVTAAL
jgi:hypothetical protein